MMTLQSLVDIESGRVGQRSAAKCDPPEGLGLNR
jgi:hypothetical protein